MSYEAKVYNVMIASPGDVASERSIIRETIYEWNTVHSQLRKIVLLPVGWESHSTPEMGGRPQEIINNQLLDKCDLLVGVFWTRIGTSTGKHLSGTVEEIENHIKSNKPTMLYFSDQPARLDSVDQDQYEKLKEFKKSCQTRGLYQTYDSHSEFKEKFYHHLQIKLNEHTIFFSNNEPPVKANIIQTNTLIPNLTNEARVLLKEASLDSHGTIIYFEHLGGTTIQTNGKNLIPNENPREIAIWKAAIEGLAINNLIEDQGYKGEVFQVTALGYQVADMIEF